MTVDVPDFVVSTPLWLALATTAVGAVEGAAIGRRADEEVPLDVVGMAVFALFLGLGGGFARDTMLGNTPFVALRTPWYLVTVLGAIVAVLIVGRWIPVNGVVFVLLDALTVGLYAAIGTQYAVDFGVPAVGAVLVGAVAALTGGVIVSVLQGQTPAILRPGVPYALIAVAGCLVYLLLRPVSGGLASFGCVALVVLVRFVVVRLDIRTRPVRPLYPSDPARRRRGSEAR